MNAISAMRALRCDVLVLGGGPAGAAAAIELSRLGDAVVLVETHRAAQHTPCQSLPPVVAGPNRSVRT